jgi:PAS domain S-box-containing protein
MKKFYFKTSLVLLFFFLVVAAAQYFFSQSLLNTLAEAGFHQDDAAIIAKIRTDIGSLFQIHLLILLVLGILFFFFFWMAFLRPLGEIRQALDRPRADSIADRMLPQRGIFHEIPEIITGIDGLWRQVRGKSEEIEESQDHLEALMRTAQVMVVIFDPQFLPIYLNEYGMKKLQVNKEEMAHIKISDLMGKPFTQQMSLELDEQGNLINKEMVLTLRNGEKMDVDFSLSRIFDSHKKITNYIAVIADITKRKRAEINLKNQILYSNQIFQSIPEMIVITDRNLRITFINRRAKEVVNQIEFNVIGQTIHILLSKKSNESGFDELLRNIILKGKGINQINVLNPFLEEENYVDLVIEPLRSGQTPIGSIVMIRDISEWRNLTSQLRLLQGFMQKLINASPYAVISINEDSLINTWNLSAERILKVPFAEAFGKNLFSILPLFDHYRDTINEVMILKKTVYLSDEKIFIGEEDFIVANLTLYPVTTDQSGAVIHIEDVSELKKLESTLLQAQKMESLGVLTSSIIHDFNNVLSGILGYASLLERKVGTDPKLNKYVSTIISSSERASSLINQILNFSRKKLSEKEVININDLIRETLDFIILNLKNIRVDVTLFEGKILLSADRTKISQSIINLVMNAKDAFAKTADPVIRIRTDRIAVKGQKHLLDGQYALIEVSDNGCGISRENQSKIFEPFFTTKGQGKGTGLGLAIVREIVKDYNGDIEVESEIDKGTTFRIFLPTVDKTDYIPVAETKKETPAQLEGSVLLIDDEEVIREIGAEMLRTIGLECFTAADGREGIELYKQKQADITLVILDIEMPGISGDKVFQILRDLNPQVKILIASGYSREYLESNIFKTKLDHYIPKPFRIEQLSFQIDRLMKGTDA